MKKIIILLLLFSFCGDNSETSINRLAVEDSLATLNLKETTTTTKKIVNNTTTTTVFDEAEHRLMLDNFQEA